MNQPGMICQSCSRSAEQETYFPDLVSAWEYGLARQVRPSRPALACSFSTPRLIVVLAHGIPPVYYRDGVHIYLRPPSGQSRVYRVTQFRTGSIGYGWQFRSWSAEQGEIMFPCPPVRVWELRQVTPSRPASSCSYPYSGWIWCLLARDSSRFPRPRPFIYLNHHTPSGQSRVYRVTQLRTDGIHCRESAGTGPVVVKVVPVTSAALAGHHGPINMCLFFPTPTIGLNWACWKYWRRYQPVWLPILLVVGWTGKIVFPVPVRAWKFDLARQVWPSRPASACSFSTLSDWIWCLLACFLAPSATASIYLHRQPPSGQSRV